LPEDEWRPAAEGVRGRTAASDHIDLWGGAGSIGREPLGGTLDPLLAGLLVIAATAISVALVAYLHNQEARRPFTWLQLLWLTLWFLVTFGLMAFLVIPD